jgi:NADH:ubiquinone reductase (H+-translocating)
LGRKRRELEGPIAFAAWKGIHALLMSTVRNKVEAFSNRAWKYFGTSRLIQVLDRTSEAHIYPDGDTDELSGLPNAKAAA